MLLLVVSVVVSENLEELPVDHVLRNTPLKDINAAFRRPDEKTWKSVKPLRISNNTYNDLYYGWTKWDIWRGELDV
jgi:hypothetical protein